MKQLLGKFLHNTLIGRSLIFPILQALSKLAFRTSADYWELRYKTKGNSGDGSYGRLANYKAEIINEHVARHNINTVLEFGCGDGHQLSLANYPAYIGLDVSLTALQQCISTFSGDNTKSFFLYSPFAFKDAAGIFKSDITLSLDVIYHLIEDPVFEKYLHDLFACSSQWVIIYSSNQEDANTLAHVRHRKFTDYVSCQFPDWKLVEHLGNQFDHQPGVTQTSFADFYIYRKLTNGLR